MPAGDLVVCIFVASVVLLAVAGGMYASYVSQQGLLRKDIARRGCVAQVQYYEYQWWSSASEEHCMPANCTGAPVYGPSFNVMLRATVLATWEAMPGFCDGVDVCDNATLEGHGVEPTQVVATQGLVAARSRGEYYLHRTHGGLVTSHTFVAQYPAVNNTLTPHQPHSTPAFVAYVGHITLIIACTGFAALFGSCCVTCCYVVRREQRFDDDRDVMLSARRGFGPVEPRPHLLPIGSGVYCDAQGQWKAFFTRSDVTPV